jgi:hypothetical protein
VLVIAQRFLSPSPLAICSRNADDIQGEGRMPIIDEEAARAAVALALPTIRLAMADPAKGDSGCLHVVVMHPQRAPERCRFQEAILHEHSVNREQWDADYALYARAKALVSWRNQCDSHAVQALEPWRIEPGQTLLWGSVCQHGVVVAVSGMQPWFDEALAGVVASCLRGIAKARAAAAAGEGAFLSGT